MKKDDLLYGINRNSEEIWNQGLVLRIKGFASCGDDISKRQFDFAEQNLEYGSDIYIKHLERMQHIISLELTKQKKCKN